MNYFIIMIISFLSAIIIIYLVDRYQKRQLFQHKLKLELLDHLLLIKKLEKIVKKELEKVNKDTTDENIISFLKDNKKLLSKEYEKTEEDVKKKINFEDVFKLLIYKKTNK